MKIFQNMWLLFAVFWSVFCQVAQADELQKLGNLGYVGLQHCTTNYGTIMVKVRPMSEQTKYDFSQIGMAAFNPISLARQTAMRSGCYTLVGSEASARFVMTVEITSLSTQTVERGPSLAFAVFTTELKEVQVTMTIVDMRTGKVVAVETGTGEPSNYIKGADLLENMRGKTLDIKPKEMKIVATAFVNAFNNLIPSVDKPLKVLKVKALRKKGLFLCAYLESFIVSA